jgi:hypothetical protein
MGQKMPASGVPPFSVVFFMESDRFSDPAQVSRFRLKAILLDVYPIFIGSSL